MIRYLIIQTKWNNEKERVILPFASKEEASKWVVPWDLHAPMSCHYRLIKPVE